MIVAEFLCAKLAMHTTNVIADGVLLGVLFARVKEISFNPFVARFSATFCSV